jgi:outer membrane protein TolC
VKVADKTPGGEVKKALDQRIAELQDLARVKRSLLEEGDGFSFYRPAIEAGQIPAALAGDFTLATLEAVVYTRNKMIASARKRAEAALESFSQIENLDLLLLRYSAYTASSMNKVGPMKGKEPTAMYSPSPGLTALKGEVVAAGADAARHKFEATVRDVITMARTLYWNLLYIDSALKIRRETLELLKRMERVALTRYEAGKTGFQNVIKIRIRRTTLEETLETLAQKELTLKAKVAQLAALPQASDVGAPFDALADRGQPWHGEPAALPTLQTLALTHLQELNALRSSIAKMAAMIEMGEKMAVPAFDLGLSRFEDEAAMQVGTQAMKPTFATKTTASTGAGAPKKPWYATGESYLSEARTKLSASRLMLADAETRAGAAVLERWYLLDGAKRDWALFESSTVGLARAAFDVSLKGYEAGRVSFVDLIDSYNGWLSALLGRTRKFCDSGIAWAELEKTVGRQLSTVESGADKR